MKSAHLPSTIGVYLFKKDDQIIYIGKSVNIKARVKSHIKNGRHDIKEYRIIHEATAVEYIITDSEFKALILESSLIQKYHPKYNVIWKDGKSYLYIKITIKDSYPKIFLTRKEYVAGSMYFGPFSSVKTTTELLREIRRIIPFCTQKTIGSKGCFYSKIGLCNPCPNIIEKGELNMENRSELKKKYRKNIRLIIKLLKGNIDSLLIQFQKKLEQFSKDQNYEEALIMRNKIINFEDLVHRRSFQNDLFLLDYNQSPEALKSLRDILEPYFPKLNSLHRIECYDISNLSQKHATGSLVVLIDGLIDKSQYKRFRIKSKTSQSDFEMMEEILIRRFKNQWEHPNLLIVDGGRPQVQVVHKVLNSMHISLPVIGIAKNPDRIVLGGETTKTLKFIQDTLGFILIRRIRDESHRFAKKYHLLLRDRNFLI